MIRQLAISLCVFTLSAQTPGEGLRIIVVEGQDAINNIRDRTARAPVVRVEDESEHPVSGATVNFTLPEFGASGYFPGGRTTLSVTTGPDGSAVAAGLRPNNVAGRFAIRVTVSYSGRSGSATISQTNVAPAASATKSRRKYILIGALVAAAAGGGLVAARGGGSSGSGSGSAGSPAGGATVTPGSPVFGPPR